MVVLAPNKEPFTNPGTLTTLKGHSHIREARRCLAVDATARECKRVESDMLTPPVGLPRGWVNMCGEGVRTSGG